MTAEQIGRAPARFMAAHMAANPEASFNDGLIRWRRTDDVKGYLEDVFKALEVVEGIKLSRVRIERDESKFPLDLCHNDIEESRLDLALIDFTLTCGDQTENLTLRLFLPKLLDDLFFRLNGSLYFPILQLVDRGTYVTRKSFTLKTLLMPLVFRTDQRGKAPTLAAIPQEESEGMLFVLDIFRQKVNVMHYLYAAKGLNGALDFLGATDNLVVVATAEVDAEAAAEYTIYAAPPLRGGKTAPLAVAAKKSWLEASGKWGESLALTVAASLEGVSVEQATEDDPKTWRRRLGRLFTQNSNSYEDKAGRILVSLERVLDRRTQKNLDHVAPDDKADVYCILRWMMREYETLSKEDNMDVRNKRIRLSEYLIHPLLMNFSEKTYRLLNSRQVTFKQLQGIFRNVNPYFVVKRLVNNDLLRYSNLVNQADLFGVALRYTTRGPQSMGDRGQGDVNLRFRGHHPSYVGRIALAAASASDPGVSGTLTPFAPTRGQFFEPFPWERQ